LTSTRRSSSVRMASLIETCKLNLVNPQSCLTDVLTRLVDGWPQSRIDELMPTALMTD
jgi:transposase